MNISGDYLVLDTLNKMNTNVCVCDKYDIHAIFGINTTIYKAVSWKPIHLSSAVCVCGWKSVKSSKFCYSCVPEFEQLVAIQTKCSIHYRNNK